MIRRMRACIKHVGESYGIGLLPLKGFDGYHPHHRLRNLATMQFDILCSPHFVKLKPSSFGVIIHVVNIFYNSSRMACKNVSISASVPTLTRSELATIGGVRKYRTKMRRFSSFS